METVILAAMTLLLVPLAVYAQLRIPRHTQGRVKVLLTRVLLAAIGVAFGGISAVLYATRPGDALLVFLGGFGAVHFPAALILFFKSLGRAGKS